MKRLLVSSYVLLCCLLPVILTAQEKVPQLQGDNMSLQYLVKAPATITKHTPVIILLHGVGSNEKDLFGLAGQLPANALIISARAPITLSPNSYAWYHIDFKTGAPSINNGEAEHSRELILAFIKEIINKYNADPSQVFLVGFSQGAIMSYSIGLTEPSRVKGIMVLSGRVLDEVKSKVASMGKLDHLNVFVAHGSNDKILPVSYAHEAHEYLLKLKMNPTYHEYPMGHEITTAELKDINDWLKKEIR